VGFGVLGLATWQSCKDSGVDGESVPVPERYSRIDPWVISLDTEAEIAFLEAVFDAKETTGSRMLGSDGRIGHVEVELGDSVVMLFDAHPDWPALPSHLRIYVDDTQGTVDRAIAAGARLVTRATDLAFGERVARVRDPQGHLWWIHQRVEDVDGEKLNARFADPSALRAMAYVQQSLSDELSSARTQEVAGSSPASAVPRTASEPKGAET
jgi:PhnB protein